MPPQKTQEIPGFFACLGAKKVHGSFIDAKPDFWPYVGPEVATGIFSPIFESVFQKYFTEFGQTSSPGNKKIKKATDFFQIIFLELKRDE